LNLIRLGAIALLGMTGWSLYKKRKRKIFVSYHSKNDARYKNLLNAWQNNQDFEFDFHDNSVGISIKTDKEDRIKAGITSKLNKSNLLLCIVGKETHLRPMVNWELEKAKELGKKIIIIKIQYHYKTPKCLLSSNTKIINGFKKEEIVKEIYRS
jgi:hypothetical protein